MITDPESALVELNRLDLPTVFQDINAGHTPVLLQGHCDTPKIYYVILPNLQSEVLASQNWLPLWECNLDSIVAYDMQEEVFIRFYYDDHDLERLGKGYQQFISKFLLELGDAGMLDELEEIARLFEYQYLDRLRLLMSHWNGATDDADYCAFMASIAD